MACSPSSALPFSSMLSSPPSSPYRLPASSPSSSVRGGTKAPLSCLSFCAWLQARTRVQGRRSSRRWSTKGRRRGTRMQEEEDEEEEELEEKARQGRTKTTNTWRRGAHLAYGVVQKVCTRNVTSVRRSLSCSTFVTNLEVQDTDFLDTPIIYLMHVKHIDRMEARTI